MQAGHHAIMEAVGPAQVPVLEWNPSGSGTAAGSAAISPRGMTALTLGGWVYAADTRAINACPLFGWPSTGSWGGLSIGFNERVIYTRGGNSARQGNNGQSSPSNTWIHAALVWTTSKFTTYVNGEVVSDISNSLSSVGSNVGTVFRCVGNGGYGDSDVVNHWWSQLGLFALFAFDRALSSDEILDIYNGRKAIDVSKAPYNNGLLFGYNFTAISDSRIPNVVAGGTPLTVANGQDVSFNLKSP